MVAGEHAEAAGVLRQRVADAELGRQVGDRPRPVAGQRRVPGLGTEALRLARDGRSDRLDVAGVGGQLREARRRRGGEQLEGCRGAGIGREGAEQTRQRVVPLGGEAVGERAERRERLRQDGKGGQSVWHGLTLQGGISQSSAMRSMGELLGESARLAGGVHHDPHGLLGPHRDGASLVIRTWQPGAASVRLVLEDGREREMRRVGEHGLFTARLRRTTVPGYRFDVARDGAVHPAGDPYRFAPTIGALDLHLIGEGTHRRLWDALGARPLTVDDVAGVAFAVWAPAARGVTVIGDFNGWDHRRHPMRSMGGTGVWELFVPDARAGDRYKLAIHGADGVTTLRADPLAREAEVPPATASIVAAARHVWDDDEWMATRGERHRVDRPMSVYEVHLGSWRQGLDYRGLAETLPAYVAGLGFTHVELMPVMAHPFGGSWGYQVTGYYAVDSRLGTPDDLRFLIDRLHAAGIGVILDWVPGHFPRDEFALARFDGTALYEHADPRLGAHPDWGTLIFNYGRTEVRNFLVANALYWLAEFHADGLRVDAVASMLYLDYSRAAGEWLPNVFGGNENLAAIAFLREMNTVVYAEHPGAFTAAEESTAWPGVSRPVHDGGLGLRLQVEHGLHARHARVHRPRPGLPEPSPRRPHAAAAVGLRRELRPAGLARRGRARKGFAVRPHAG